MLVSRVHNIIDEFGLVESRGRPHYTLLLLLMMMKTNVSDANK